MDRFKEIVQIMEILRGSDGCPWDKGQDHDSIKPYLIEETYEVLEAIDSKDDEKLKEELGDLILQIIFHAQIAKERGAFDIQDVLARLSSKLKLRHPHVFSDLEVKDEEEVLRNWEKIKLRSGHPLSGIPKTLPALLLARRIQDKLIRIGKNFEMDMTHIEDRFRALRRSLFNETKKVVEKMFGELLFLLVGIARKEGIDAEDALRKKVIALLHDHQYIAKLPE